MKLFLYSIGVVAIISIVAGSSLFVKKPQVSLEQQEPAVENTPASTVEQTIEKVIEKTVEKITPKKQALSYSDSPSMPYVEFVNPSGFVNTEAFTMRELVGTKVVLIEFMTYSCINCQRTFPYVNTWYEKYKDQGLEIVGIHTPEFSFERNIDNVREAMKKEGITYPIVLDNDYATWRAYGNNYWPRQYLIDIDGNVVYDHIGEGAYRETEEKIQELLAERKERLGE